MSEWFKTLPEVWKIILAVVAIFAAGFTTHAALYQFTTIPRMVSENQRQIQENRMLLESQIDDLVSEIESLKLELRLSNCLLLKERDPTVVVRDCLTTPGQTLPRRP